MLEETKDGDEYKSLPPYVRALTRIIIWQVTFLYFLLKRFHLVPKFEIVSYKTLLEDMGFEFYELDEAIDVELNNEKKKDEEPPLQ